MRKLLTFQFIIFVTTLNCFAQFKVSPNIIKEYDTVYGQLSGSSRQLLSNSNSFALCTSYQVDTLNKFQQQDFSSINVAAVDSAGNPLPRSATNKNITYPAPLIFSGHLNKDTLVLSANAIDIGFTTKIYRQQTNSIFSIRCRDTVYRLTLDNTAPPGGFDTKATVITGTLSSKIFKPGDTLYGELDLYTPPFYAYDLGFTNMYIKQRLRWKYYFKTVLK